MTEKSIAGIIFSNMHDNDLGPIAIGRTTGSVPFGGKYRMIDFILSSMVNSGVKEVGVIAKAYYQSLLSHLGSGREWDLSRKKGGLTVLPPYSSVENQGIYAGHLDAVSGVFDYLKNLTASYVLLCDSDLIANIDFKKMLDFHLEKQAEITLAYTSETDYLPAHDDVLIFGLDQNQRIRTVKLVPEPDREQNFFSNIALMSRELLLGIIQDAKSRNQRSFRKDIFMDACPYRKIFGYPLPEVNMRIDSMLQYYKANLSLLSASVREGLFKDRTPILTHIRDTSPVRYGSGADVRNSIVTDGCNIEGAVKNSVLFRNVKISKGAMVQNSVIMEGVVIGEDAHIDSVIVDRNSVILDSCTLIGQKNYPLYLPMKSVV